MGRFGVRASRGSGQMLEGRRRKRSNIWINAPILELMVTSAAWCFPRPALRYHLQAGGQIVLTAHPTQINRGTLQYKHIRLSHLLNLRDRPDLTSEDRDMVIEDLVREITSVWQTDELRRHKPTPGDEARAGLNIVQQSLWKAVPHYLRCVSDALKKFFICRYYLLTLENHFHFCTPIRYGSWRGEVDRDGNSNVTAKVTKDVSLLSRWMTIDLYIQEVDSLKFELSMNRCGDILSKLAQEILDHSMTYCSYFQWSLILAAWYHVVTIKA
ncbi:putative phosphoenolpyruvate carboxylase [Rosa chinensis]|uniref:Putative phosphoenolpyruvate carboxylase n=1 Tax=Rosa chinensis TaxID=74649 RepID=A0A2P6QBA0_ROSCH|nr:putative phosphoenolpyruvate carboxylase [Rosa chinensis]